MMKSLKPAPALAAFWSLFLLLNLGACTFLAQKVSQEEDATIAFKLPDPDVSSFRYADRKILQQILGEQLGKYRIAVGYLKKAAALYEGAEGTAHDKKVVKVEMQINDISSQVKNLGLIYPDQWEEEKNKLIQSVQQLRDLYKEAYHDLV